MADNLQLVKPSVRYRDAYLSFYEEWRQSGEDIVPWVVEKDPRVFEDLVQFLIDSEREENTPTGWVPHSTYWLMNENHQIVGAVNLRHRLNEKLLHSGGHIGYGIRPSERRKGYATQLLSRVLEKAVNELGLEKVLLVCDKGNTGSERTILKHGGVFESEYVEEDGNVVRRFWITL